MPCFFPLSFVQIIFLLDCFVVLLCFPPQLQISMLVYWALWQFVAIDRYPEHGVLVITGSWMTGFKPRQFWKCFCWRQIVYACSEYIYFDHTFADSYIFMWTIEGSFSLCGLMNGGEVILYVQRWMVTEIQFLLDLFS